MRRLHAIKLAAIATAVSVRGLLAVAPVHAPSCGAPAVEGTSGFATKITIAGHRGQHPFPATAQQVGGRPVAGRPSALRTSRVSSPSSCRAAWPEIQRYQGTLALTSAAGSGTCSKSAASGTAFSESGAQVADTTVDVNRSCSTPVGITAQPGNAPTKLLQLNA
jgi:hypothetical protein